MRQLIIDRIHWYDHNGISIEPNKPFVNMSDEELLDHFERLVDNLAKRVDSRWMESV